jgi:Holliday junction resolvasome RuvABC endonuclease subunit
MAKQIEIVAFDPSMSNFGICEAGVNIDTLELEIRKLTLISTSSEANKGVIKVSDNLRRAREVQEGMIAACEGKAFAIAEIPLMISSHNAKIASLANYNAGMMVGVLASLNIPLIQVFPKDVKMTATGLKDACKEEMIEWAMRKYPTAPWLLRKLRGKMVPVAANEHLADAVAAAETGLKDEQFKRSLAMYRSMAA